MTCSPQWKSFNNFVNSLIKFKLFKFIPLDMLTIVLLGTGNVAVHLFHAIRSASSAQILQVYGRNSDALENFKSQSAVTTVPESIVQADLYIMAVKDDAIAEVSLLLKAKKGLVAHTSGSVPLTRLANKRRAVFYPLQTFTKGISVDFSAVPICLETESKEDSQLLEGLAASLSQTVCHINSEQRLQLHVAAIFANNFTNYLYYLAEDVCKDEGLNFELLFPLIQETAKKIRFLPPKMAQTGPARRRDTSTILKHLDMLSNPVPRKVYEVLSHAIQKMYEKEL